MAQIIRKENNGIEFFTVQETGESGMSISGLAIVCGVSQQAITRLINNLTTKSPSKTLEPLIGKDCTLQPTYIKQGGQTKIINSEACTRIIRHYDKLGYESAGIALDKFTSIGINTWIQSITGWEKGNSTPQLSPYLIRLEHFNITKKFLPKGYWCVFGETANLLSVISELYPVGVYDLVDGSVGKRWAIYRNDKEWCEPRLQYPHHFPDQRGIKDAWCYSFKELPLFREWFQDIYEVQYLPAYLQKKYGKIVKV